MNASKSFHKMLGNHRIASGKRLAIRMSIRPPAKMFPNSRRASVKGLAISSMALMGASSQLGWKYLRT